MLDKDFYPTPPELCERMFSKVKGWDAITSVLEPSAGTGSIIEELKEYSWRNDAGYRGSFRHSNVRVSAIEINNDCRHVLIGKGIDVIDTDFLLYSGRDQFDLIVANFPFSEGDKHLHKAIDILFSGQIVCLLNAETLRNPYTNSRKHLIKRLKDLNAEIEYIDGAFKYAERKTNVEVALIYINKDVAAEDTILKSDENEDIDIEVDFDNSIAVNDPIDNLVHQYNKCLDIVINQIIEYYRNYSSVSNYIRFIVPDSDDYDTSGGNIVMTRDGLTRLMKRKVNYVVYKARKDYWLKLLDSEKVRGRLTVKKFNSFVKQLSSQCVADFTIKNIELFLNELKDSYYTMVLDSIEDVFDECTMYAFHERYNYKENIHLYNGWKTNDAFKINKKVIYPIYLSNYGSSYSIGSGADFLQDLDLVLSYFDTNKGSAYRVITNKVYNRSSGEYEMLDSPYTPMHDVRDALGSGKKRGIMCRYFIVDCFLKGTVHIKFTNMDVLRRFNIYVGKKRGWLPFNYATKESNELSNEDKKMVTQFESEEEYSKIGDELTANIPLLLAK